MTKRLTTLTDKSEQEQEADMKIRMVKTYSPTSVSFSYSQHVRTQIQQEVGEKDTEEIQSKIRFLREKIQDGQSNVHSQRKQTTHTTTEGVFEVEDIIVVFGRIRARWMVPGAVGQIW